MKQPNENELSKLDKATTSFGKWVVKYKWLVLALSISITIGCGFGLSKLKFNSETKVFFSKDNPQLVAFERIENVYSKDENILIALADKNGNVFTAENLAAIKALADSAWKTPYSFRVDAITNFQHTRANEDGLIVSDLVERTDSLSSEDLARIKEIAIREPLLKNRLVNEKGSITAINISCKPSDADALPQMVSYIRNLTATWGKAHPQFDIYISGNVFLSNAFSETAQGDGQTLIPLVFLIFIIMIFLTIRSIASTISAFIAIAISIACALGTAALLGIELTSTSANTPIVICTLAIADCIHLTISILNLMRAGMTKDDAIVESFRQNTIPVIITSVTTIIGFLSLNTGDVPPYADFGNISALGMTFALLFALTTVPALMSIIPFNVKQSKEIVDENKNIYHKVADFAIEKRNPILIATVVLLLIGSFFTMKNELNDEFIKYFDKSITFRKDSDFINENLTGIYSLEFSVPSGGEGEINNPEYLNKLDDFAKFIEKQPEVVHVSSFSEVSKRVNRAMHADKPEYYSIPTSQQEAAQYLLLYELSLPYGLDLNNQVNNNKSETRLSITLKEISSQKMIDVAQRLENWLKANAPAHMHVTGSSVTHMFAHIGERQVKSLISGSIMSAILITLVLMITFRSMKYGFISIISNVVPAIIGFGIWYFILGRINLGMTAVFGMTLGIIVDNTIHFISKYLRAKRELHLTSKQAIEYSFDKVGRAIVATNLILCVGFFVLTQSTFLINSSLALITIIILMASVVICLVALPGIIIKFNKSTN